ncbi:hypothetical protein DVH05_028247 [Phytophthora capsici]|nr:hypothetical protein DVH05_028247 [Phytophthora capsici]
MFYYCAFTTAHTIPNFHTNTVKNSAAAFTSLPNSDVADASAIEAQTLQQEDGSLEDIGDGIDGDEIFPRWEEYFAEVFDDDELGTAFVASDSDSTYRGWEFEPIPEPDQTPYPALDDPNFPQENRVTGIRALKSSLAALFGSQE